MTTTTFVNGTVIQPAWLNDVDELVYNTDNIRTFNVKTDFDAAGDGTTDDTAEIQAAIDAAKATSTGGGEVYFPPGQYKITGPLDLTGLFFTDSVKLRGAGRFASQILAAFNGGTVLDLSGSVLVEISDLGIKPSGVFVTDQVILCARLTSNNSAGNHIFRNLYVEGACNNAIVVLWGSEENQFSSCWITCGNDGSAACDVPALVMAGKILEAGFTPTSSFQTLGTGNGGVGMNTFMGCRFANETGIVQTSPLLKLYGTLGSAFYNCFFASWTPNTIDINCTYSATATDNLYPAVVTFDSCSDENAWGNQTTQRSIYFSTPNVGSGSLINIAGLTIRNCQFFRIHSENGVRVDGFRYDGGKFSNSVAAPTGSKGSFYNLTNAFISVSEGEKQLTWTVTNTGVSNYYRGITAGNVALGTDTTSVISDASGNLLHSGYLLSKSSTGGVGYSTGAGGAVTQITSSATAVTLDKVAGQITTVALTTAAGAEEVFQVNCSVCTILDVPVVSTTYTGAGTPIVSVKGVANGGFVIVITNVHSADALNAVMVINFALVRAVAS